MLVALGTLAAAQIKGTEKTTEATTQLLNYAATHPDVAIRYHKSDMTLYAHSDASYLSEPQARSRVGGYFYLGNHNSHTKWTDPCGKSHNETHYGSRVRGRNWRPIPQWTRGGTYPTDPS